MHPSSVTNMKKALDIVQPKTDIRILDVGGRNIKPDRDRSYKHLFTGGHYYIADLNAGYNVTHHMKGPYSIPLADDFVDLVVSGQTLEHVKNPFRMVAEMARVLKPGGHMILIAPSTGHRHDSIDCWRFMDDGFKAIAEETGLHVVADWIDKSSPDERSQRWSDHVFIGRK